LRFDAAPFGKERQRLLDGCRHVAEWIAVPRRDERMAARPRRGAAESCWARRERRP
jgi:hypothetical protein